MNKIIKSKKYVLSLGALAIASIPIAISVSCGSSTPDKGPGNEGPGNEGPGNGTHVDLSTVALKTEQYEFTGDVKVKLDGTKEYAVNIFMDGWADPNTPPAGLKIDTNVFLKTLAKCLFEAPAEVKNDGINYHILVWARPTGVADDWEAKATDQIQTIFGMFPPAAAPDYSSADTIFTAAKEEGIWMDPVNQGSQWTIAQFQADPLLKYCDPLTAFSEVTGEWITLKGIAKTKLSEADFMNVAIPKQPVADANSLATLLHLPKISVEDEYLGIPLHTYKAMPLYAFPGTKIPGFNLQIEKAKGSLDVKYYVASTKVAASETGVGKFAAFSQDDFDEPTDRNAIVNSIWALGNSSLTETEFKAITLDGTEDIAAINSKLGLSGKVITLSGSMTVKAHKNAGEAKVSFVFSDNDIFEHTFNKFS